MSDFVVCLPFYSGQHIFSSIPKSNFFWPIFSPNFFSIFVAAHLFSYISSSQKRQSKPPKMLNLYFIDIIKISNEIHFTQYSITVLIKIRSYSLFIVFYKIAGQSCQACQ